MKKEYIIIGVFVTIIVLAVIFKDTISEMVNGESTSTGTQTGGDVACKKHRVVFKFSDYSDSNDKLQVNNPKLTTKMTHQKVVDYFSALTLAGVPNTYEPRKGETFSFLIDNQYLAEFERQVAMRQTPLAYEISCV